MRADFRRVTVLLAVALLAAAATSCSGGEKPVRIGLLTDCRGLSSGYEGQMLAGAELPLLERGARLAKGTLSGGVSGAQVAGSPVELVGGCTENSEYTILLEEARRLVEVENVDAIVGPMGEGDSLVIRELARKHPEVVFIPIWSSQELTLRHPAANVYQFETDEAQDVAGLGSHAYRELGWRSAAVVAEPYGTGWQEEAAFVAEFCALGGNVTTRLTAPVDVHNPKVARAFEDADGVAVFVSRFFVSPEFLLAVAHAVESPQTRMVVGTYVLEDPTMLAPNGAALAGVVGGSSIPPVNATPAMRSYRAAFSKAFPGLPPSFAEATLVLAFHDAMEGLLRGLEASEGDLSSGRLHKELARLRFDLPSGPVRLDRNRQAVRNTYLKRVGRERGKTVLRLVRVVPEVEQTFGGLLSDAPAPGPGSQPCRRATPPPWGR